MKVCVFDMQPPLTACLSFLIFLEPIRKSFSVMKLSPGISSLAFHKNKSLSGRIPITPKSSVKKRLSGNLVN